jgi:hypothetical protein
MLACRNRPHCLELLKLQLYPFNFVYWSDNDQQTTRIKRNASTGCHSKLLPLKFSVLEQTEGLEFLGIIRHFSTRTYAGLLSKFNGFLWIARNILIGFSWDDIAASTAVNRMDAASTHCISATWEDAKRLFTTGSYLEWGFMALSTPVRTLKRSKERHENKSRKMYFDLQHAHFPTNNQRARIRIGLNWLWTEFGSSPLFYLFIYLTTLSIAETI